MYCTEEDISNQISNETLIQLTDDTGLGAVNQAHVSDALLFAEVLINGYLLSRYKLPVNPETLSLLKILATDLSIYRLYLRRFQTDVPTGISDKYKNAIKMLEQIQKGVIALETEARGNIIPMNLYRTNKTAKDRIFTKELLDDY